MCAKSVVLSLPQYATVELNGEKYMTLNDFVCKYLGLLDPELADQETMRRMGAMADTTQDELVITA